MIPFGPWLPDAPDFQNPGATVAQNVIPDVASYRPLPAAVDASGVMGSLTSAPCGATYVDTGAATGAVHAGNGTKLFRYTLEILTQNAWADVSRATGGAYAAAQWRFAQFGSRVVAVNGSDVAQSYVEGTSTDYAALAGSPPAAPRTIAVVRDFLQMAPASNVLTWSAQNDPTDWTPSATTQSDSQTIPEGGIIRGQVGGQYGVIFMERAIYRQTYVGPPLIFQFDKIAENTGLSHDGTLAVHENMAFFWSGEAFLMLVDGQQIVPIGIGKVDRYFSDLVTRSYSAALAFRFMSAAVDPENKLYCVTYSAGQSSPFEIRMLMYHWPSGRWADSLFGTQVDN